MKILAIRGKNLASLAGEFEVDFTVEPLKNAGIFAITGSTGSGKSTLLDALCLALFDSTPRMTKARESKVELADVRNKTIAQSDSRSVLRRGTAEGYAEVDFIALTGETYRSTWTACRAGGKPSGILRSVGFRLMNLSKNTEEQGTRKELLAKVSKLIGLSFEQFNRSVLLAQGDFAVDDAARHVAVKVQRIRDIRDSVRFFVGVGDQQGVLVQLALCKAQLRKNAAVVQLVPHHHVGQKGAVLQRLLRGQHLPPHMQILLPNGGQGFVHLPVIAHGHLCTGLLRRMVKLCAEVRHDGVV